MKNMDLKRCIAPAACACGLAVFAVGCSPNWVAGDPPEVPRGAYIEDTATAAAPDAVPEAGPISEPIAPLAPAPAPAPAPVSEKAAKPSAPEANLVPVEAVAPAKPAAAANSKDIAYKVQRDDTLKGIAIVYGVPLAALAERNGLTAQSKIWEGQTIYIPEDMMISTASKPMAGVQKISDLAPVDAQAPAQTPAQAPADGGKVVKHKVQSGEMLGTIAPLYGVKVADIIQANHLDAKGSIRAGQELVIPNPKKTPSAADLQKRSAPKAKAPAKAPAKTQKNVKTVKPDSTPAAPAPAAEPAAVAPAAPAGEPTADDLLGGSATTPAAEPAVAPAPAAKPAEPAKKEPVSLEPEDTLSFSLGSPSTLGKIAQQHGYKPETLLKLNPGIGLNDTLESGRVVILPLISDAE